MTTSADLPVPARPRATRRRVRRAIALIVAIPVVAVAVLALSQHVLRARAYANHAVPGRSIDLGGRSLRVVEAGLEHRGRGPTVILETGWAGSSLAWQHVLPEVGRHAYVIAYDRAGHGFSDAAGGPRDGGRVADDLRALLDADDVPGPYLLVGHSLGGPYARIFAARHRDDVAGLVLVDASHPDQLARAPRIRAEMEEFEGTVRMLPTLARLGVIRVIGALSAFADGLTGDHHALAVEFLADPRHLAAARAEMEAWDATMDLAREASDFGDLPVRIVTAGTDPGGPEFADLQRDFLALSRDASRVVVDDATHLSIVMDPEHAPVVAETIVALVHATR